MRGGSRPGAGRKKGSPNKASAERQAEIAATGLTPLDYMIKVMRADDADPHRRDDMAKAAAPYIHPRLSAVEHTGADGGPIAIEGDPNDTARRVAFLLAQGAQEPKKSEE